MNGATVVEPESVKQVYEFYSILKHLYRQKVKKPLPDVSFFESFYHKTNAEGHGKIFLVQHEGKIIGGILCPMMKNKSMFEWYVCGLDKLYVAKNIYPSVLATWAALEYATLNNIRQFDFMGLGKPGVKYGVRDFKLRFGGKVVNYGRLIRINRPVFYWIAELGFNFLSLIKKL
jgi:lipid II:glycine glycyltransferase (peptidoglycan interpeptide bridge formation enzyme)